MEAGALPTTERLANRFVTTRWSIVLSCTGAEEGGKAAKALAELCETYWRPILAFICRRGYSPPDAQDLTQDFFYSLLQGNLLRRADPNRGRFRSLLLKALKNFLLDQHDKRRARKRGGDMHFISWDAWMAEAPSYFALPAREDESWSPERIFDVHWAATAAENALRKLADECELRGRRRVFDVLRDCLAAEREDVSYENLSKLLAIPAPTIKRLVHQLRVRYRALLRQEVAQTVATPGEIDEELRYLCAALAAAA